MPNLYELSTEIRAITNEIEDCDGEINESILARLDELNLEFPAKMNAVAKWHSELKARAAGLEVEAKRIRDLAAAAATRAEGVKKYMHNAMETAGIKKMETDAHTLLVQRNSVPSVSLADGAPIPEEFVRTKIETTLNREAVLEAYKAGKPLPETISVLQGTHLRIK